MHTIVGSKIKPSTDVFVVIEMSDILKKCHFHDVSDDVTLSESLFNWLDIFNDSNTAEATSLFGDECLLALKDEGYDVSALELALEGEDEQDGEVLTTFKLDVLRAYNDASNSAYGNAYYEWYGNTIRDWMYSIECERYMMLSWVPMVNLSNGDRLRGYFRVVDNFCDATAFAFVSSLSSVVDYSGSLMHDLGECQDVFADSVDIECFMRKEPRVEAYADTSEVIDVFLQCCEVTDLLTKKKSLVIAA